jgi:UDP-N-acetylmuramate dehydrogenase
MGLKVQENVALGPLTTFGVGGAARWFAVAKTEEDVVDAVEWARGRGVELFVLGGGSNLLVGDAGFDGLVLRMEIGGVEPCGDGCFDVGAGVVWDEFVSRMVSAGFAGVECLAGIPGSVGGTPVQNVGAYGQEVAETIEAVKVFDRQTVRVLWLNKAECGFRYRESRFNTEEPGRFVVVRVKFRLHAGGEAQLKYAELKRTFEAKVSSVSPSLAEVAAEVRKIRASKGMLILPDDPDSRSAGSFFRNPVVEEARVAEIALAAGMLVQDVPRWPAGEGRVKLPAAWLLEKAGFVKGFGAGPVGISTRHTLALVNRGGATFADVERFQQEIVAKVKEQFGVMLVREPVKLG